MMNPTTAILSSLVFAVVAVHTFMWVFYHPPTESSTSTLGMTIQTNSAPETWTLDPTCDDGNPCTRDLGHQGQCRHVNAPSTQSCQNEAYRPNTSLHCEQGLCVGPLEACKTSGCEMDMDCEGLFSLSNRTNVLGDFQFEPVRHETKCIRHQCQSHMVLIVFTSMRQTEEWWSTATGPHLSQGMLPCEEFLVQKDIDSEFSLLDPSLVNYSMAEMVQWGLSTYPIQLGLCTFQYACGRDYVHEPSPSPSSLQ